MVQIPLRARNLFGEHDVVGGGGAPKETLELHPAPLEDFLLPQTKFAG